MCVKEVEGAQGQESPYRQEKACGGDGGGGGGGSRLLSDSRLVKTHKHRLKHADMFARLCSAYVFVHISQLVGGTKKKRAGAKAYMHPHLLRKLV